MRLLRLYASICARLQLIIAATAVLAILLTISLDVGLRAVLNAPLSATIEVVSFYYMVPLVFFPVMTLELTGSHIDTDIFFHRFSPLVRRASVAVSGILTIGLYGLLGIVTLNQAIASARNGEVSMGVNLLPIWPVRWVLPIVFVSAMLAAVLLTARRLNGEDADA